MWGDIAKGSCERKSHSEVRGRSTGIGVWAWAPIDMGKGVGTCPLERSTCPRQTGKLRGSCLNWTAAWTVAVKLKLLTVRVAVCFCQSWHMDLTAIFGLLQVCKCFEVFSFRGASPLTP